MGSHQSENVSTEVRRLRYNMRGPPAARIHRGTIACAVGLHAPCVGARDLMMLLATAVCVTDNDVRTEREAKRARRPEERSPHWSWTKATHRQTSKEHRHVSDMHESLWLMPLAVAKA